MARKLHICIRDMTPSQLYVEPNPEFFCARHMPRLRQPTLLWDSPRYSESVRKALTLNRHAHCPYADFGPKKRMVLNSSIDSESRQPALL